MSWWELTWRTGPDAGASVVVASGRWVVGRAPQSHVRCDDPLIEPFHAELVLGDDRWQVIQLAGRSPLRSDERQVLLGASVLGVVRAASSPPPPTPRVEPLVVVRPPRRAVPPPPPMPEPPATADRQLAPTPLGGAMLPATVAAAVGVMAALLLGQPLMAVLAVMGAVATGAATVAQRAATWRDRRRGERADAAVRAGWEAAVDRHRDEWAVHQQRLHGSLATRLAAITAVNGDLWARRNTHDDAFTVPLGEGTLLWHEPPWPAVPVDGLPLAVRLDPGAVVVVRGAHAPATIRAIVVALAAQCGPADWQLSVESCEPARWRWLDGLPHLTDDGQADVEIAPHRVVVTDRPDLLTVRTGALRRQLDGTRPPAIVVLAGTDDPLPAVCTHLVDTRVDGTARSVADTQRPHEAVVVRIAGLGERAARCAVDALAGLRDPEDARRGAADLPERVAFVDLQRSVGIDAFDPQSVAAAWTSLGADPPPVLALGASADGRIDVDLVADGPHCLVAGTTGSGKSDLLRSVVMGLACRQPPDLLTFVLVDYKGGAAFDACTALPHVVGVVTDLDAGLAERALRGLRAELMRREALVRAVGAADLGEARRRAGASVVPRLVVVVDEFAALAAEHPDVLHALVGIAQRGRSLGVHLVLATQRPAGVVSDDIRANTQLRLALRLNDRSDALDVVGDVVAATLPRRAPGRAVLRLGSDGVAVFQTAHLGEDLAGVVDAIAAAAVDRPPVRAPWCAPLPPRLDEAALGAWLDTEVPAEAVGVIDLPESQSRAALGWRRGEGDLLVVGAPGSGLTSTLHTVVRRVVQQDPTLGVLVLDGDGDPRWDDLVAHPGCAGVVRPHERERCWRGLRWAVHGGHSDDQPLLVVIDRLDRWRRELDHLDRLDELELLDSLVAAAPSGVHLAVATAAGTTPPASFVARCAARWLLHCNDPAEAVLLGAPPGRLPTRVPGRVLDVESGEVAQVVAPEVGGVSDRHRRVRRIGVLPHRVEAGPLPAGEWTDGSWWLPLGVDAITLDPAVVEVVEGEHLLVVGPARSGRTSTLRHLARSFVAIDPAGVVVAVGPRRTGARDHRSIDEVVGDAIHRVEAALGMRRRCLFVIDDAERVPDPAGALERLVLGHRAGLVVVAAARTDAVRSCYGHWTGAVRRSRTGMLSASCHEHDGDLLGVALPRRLPVSVRPGLVHAVFAGERHLVQVGTDGRHDLDDLDAVVAEAACTTALGLTKCKA